ncbi:hypothetical protein CJ014_00795 [Pleomorphomonas carboxyditropha]|uniref:Head decoration protein n=2 Tax=Pleomorphomonas carboxyditropha TaxID=2023338 RepID=A0A2G9X193_9HYPH|nr:hypothetical protein CJ014_00795 [Pleomorphomonas carboxyditropha]
MIRMPPSPTLRMPRPTRLRSPRRPPKKPTFGRSRSPHVLSVSGRSSTISAPSETAFRKSGARSGKLSSRDRVLSRRRPLRRRSRRSARSTLTRLTTSANPRRTNRRKLMAVFVEGPRNAEWLRSEANGSRSRDVLALDQSADLYITGTLVDVETGARATADSAKLAIVYLTTDATAGAVDATVISRDAEVTGDLLVRPAGVTLAAATAKLDAVGIIVR